MKYFSRLLAMLLLIGFTHLAWAQDASSTPGSGHHHFGSINPATRQLFEQMKLQKSKINADVQSGKLTSDQASALNDKLKSIGQEMRSDFKQNRGSGIKGLTNDQIQALNKELTTNSASIP